MALEDLTGPSKFINALNSLNPDGATDTLDEADDHMKGIKNVLKNSLPNITGAMTATEAEMNSWEARMAALEVAVLTPAGQNPIGTIKLTTDNTNPGTYIAGTTWAQIAEGRTLVGEGLGAGLTSRTAGAEIGQEDAIIPPHVHPITDPGHIHSQPKAMNNLGNIDDTGSGADEPQAVANNTDSAVTGITIDDATGSEAVTDKNMQPSLIVYIWERTA